MKPSDLKLLLFRLSFLFWKPGIAQINFDTTNSYTVSLLETAMYIPNNRKKQNQTGFQKPACLAGMMPQFLPGHFFTRNRMEKYGYLLK